jgi:hypothetical protein
MYSVKTKESKQSTRSGRQRAKPCTWRPQNPEGEFSELGI